MRILVAGSEGFIGSYVVEELLAQGHDVIGIDNLSKYGQQLRQLNYTFINDDVKNTKLLIDLLDECDHFLLFAAKIGGISYFHKLAYDLLAENERILASAFDAAIYAFRNFKLKKITALSSSMIYENATFFPSKEGDERKIPPPMSTYGFQKLAVHYFCQGAYEQYGLPYTIIIPFNAIGIGEISSQETFINNDLNDSHVIPDFIKKAYLKQSPFEILGSGNQIRHFTFCGDLARAIVLSLNNEKAINQSYNIASSTGTKIVDLAKIIWRKINKEDLLDKDLKFVNPYKYDVQVRIPSTQKAESELGFVAEVSLEEALDICIPWYLSAIENKLL